MRIVATEIISVVDLQSRYDNYLKDKDGTGIGFSLANNNPRASGIGNLLLNMGDDSDDDSEDEDERRPVNPPVVKKNTTSPPLPPPKTAPLAVPIAAVSAPPRTALNQVVPAPHRQQQQQQQQQGPRNTGPPSPPRAIAAPRPGYALAAPIAALNGQASSTPPPFKPAGRPGAPPQNPFSPPAQPNNLRGPPMPFGRAPTGSPAPSSRSLAAPHPLQPPVTPISPAFIRPSSTSPDPPTRSFSGSTLASQAEPRIKFSLDQKRPSIMRGNTEETLLPSRGEKGDDFWRRFSIVAKDPASSESSWLKKTQSGTNRMSRYVWIVGVVLVVAILGGIGVGVWLSRSSPGHQQPTAIGGSADNLATGTTTTTMPLLTTAVGGAVSSIKHVSPTNTVARREPEPTPFMRLRKRQERVW